MTPQKKANGKKRKGGERPNVKMKKKKKKKEKEG